MTRARSSAVRRAGRLGAIALAAQAAGGCYSYAPVAGVAPQGADLVVEISDLGRVRLGSTIGPSPAKVEGRLNAASDTSYTLAVRSVESVRGEVTPWAGEVVTLPRAGVSVVRLKRLDRKRTVLTVGAFVGAVTAFLVTRSIILDGNTRSPGDVRPGPDPGGT